MQKLNSICLFLWFLAPVTGSEVTALGEGISPEATETVRRVAAKEKLKKDPQSVVLYAMGLCCPSCAIGVRKKVSKLDFVDRSRFNHGVELDTKTQLVTVATSEAKQVDFKSLSLAIEDAGYDPVRSYHLENGELRHTSLAAD